MPGHPDPLDSPGTALPGRVPPAGERSRRREAIAGLTVVAGLVTAVTLADPRHPGRWPSCPFHAVTGLYCPGCGSLRAVSDLVHGDLAGALGYNALTVITLPLLVAFWLRTALLAPTPGRLPGSGALPVLILVIVWGVVRNLPLAPFSLLAP
ncbi:DUF2752 domain-containing protein [Kineosporia sp. NBRC 101731]|uniref:DUF2752 domain-containing protein n=1 Tax=Kineosporia sp. NBRC 101731 TaxID=3032199 RepID=UPI0024A5000C|nr:DUF2752 domain-containing protein [Kineosporia sp. NBRC 101731]GLY29207.1 membrane protein [Kineosporia sp. NBRC 101731]